MAGGAMMMARCMTRSAMRNEHGARIEVPVMAMPYDDHAATVPATVVEAVRR